MKGSQAFRRLVAMCGLSPMFAENAMARAIVRAGIWPERMLLSDVPAVIPEVERAIKPFLDPHASARIVEQIRAWWWASGTAPTLRSSA